MTGLGNSVYSLFAQRRLDVRIADAHSQAPFSFFCQRGDLMAEGVQQMFIEVQSDLQVFRGRQVQPHAPERLLAERPEPRRPLEPGRDVRADFVQVPLCS